ncbi:MAG: imidazole glycerol phosphate synthase subunit HisH [Proteobacteria bacterium]|nr:imidazole glycerol phosphate synthase subunit HisH [Pseudomonadota bacterium]
MREIAIIDYGMSNIDSVARAVEKLGASPLITDISHEVAQADGIILPGVGSFADAMKELTSRDDLIPTIKNRVQTHGTPFLGICLGMQLMATTGYEGGKTSGLDLIPGTIRRLEPVIAEERIPHVGWNEVNQLTTSPLFHEVADNLDFYFVHSYHFQCDPQYVLAQTPYCGGFTSVVGKDVCFGVQFHPEKSLKSGTRILTNFISLC